jgi:hypothetical protein
MKGQCQMFIGDGTVVVLGRKWRSKWWTIHCCGCSKHRRRVDGSCVHERELLEKVRIELRPRVRIEAGR